MNSPEQSKSSLEWETTSYPWCTIVLHMRRMQSPTPFRGCILLLYARMAIAGAAVFLSQLILEHRTVETAPAGYFVHFLRHGRQRLPPIMNLRLRGGEDAKFDLDAGTSKFWTLPPELVGTRVGCTEFRRNPQRLASSSATPMMPSETHEEPTEEARDEGDHGENTGYPVLTAEDGHALNVGSLCVVCEKQGVTRILPSTIPWFGRVIVMSFECPHCGEKNTEVQSAAEIRPLGERITLSVRSQVDADRQVIRSRHAAVSIPELALEMPASLNGAVLTTVEGILTRAAEELEYNQEDRPEAQQNAIASVIASLRAYICGKGGEYTFVLDDPTGNSQIEGDAADASLSWERYSRTPEQNAKLGIYAPPPSEVTCESAAGGGHAPRQVSNMGQVRWGGLSSSGSMLSAAVQAAGSREVESFVVNCPSCQAEDLEKMYLTEIPHFGEILIMAFTCGSCGCRSTEIKPGSSGRHGRRIELRVTADEDWDRLVLKGAGCTMRVPELELEIESGTMGSTLTTVEGLLEKVYEHLASTRPFTTGDSASEASFASKLRGFLTRFDQLRKARECFTLILEDPMGHSNVEPPRSAREGDADERMLFEEFEPEAEQGQEEGYFEGMD